jgi:tetratricopeptide (TPR) repeat protein
MKMRIAVFAATLAVTTSLGAQSAAEHIALGDKDHAAGNAASAMRHYQAAVAADDKNAEALWRASREAIDLGEFNDATRDSMYAVGADYARRAVAADPKSAMTHFVLAKAIGRKALSLGAKERVKFAGEVRAEALESIRIDSINPGALHVMGMWNANVMRLSGVSRFMAKTFLGGKTFGEANWNDAVKYLERASVLEPDRIVHALNLAGVYRDKGDAAKAKEQYRRALGIKAVEFNDASYQAQAKKELAEMK